MCLKNTTMEPAEHLHVWGTLKLFLNLLYILQVNPVSFVMPSYDESLLRLLYKDISVTSSSQTGKTFSKENKLIVSSQ